MRLTRFTDYALRLLIFIANNQGRRVTIAEAAVFHGISRNHLMKVAQRLSESALLRASRGRSGGLALGRPAEAISLGDVLRITEPDFALVGCMAGDGCTYMGYCRLPAALNASVAAFLQCADQQKLSSFSEPNASGDMQMQLPGVGLPIS